MLPSGTSVLALKVPLNTKASAYFSVLCTNAVVAICVVLVPSAAVGAVGVPLNSAVPLNLSATIVPSSKNFNYFVNVALEPAYTVSVT